MKNEVDINEVFEDILLTEEKIYELAYREGYELGASEESIEGYHLGYHRGAEVGSEIGYYQAFAEHYNDNAEKLKVPDKVMKNLRMLKQGCLEFPRINSERIDLFEALENLRVLYKKIAAQLKIKSSLKNEGVQVW